MNELQPCFAFVVKLDWSHFKVTLDKHTQPHTHPSDSSVNIVFVSLRKASPVFYIFKLCFLQVPSVSLSAIRGLLVESSVSGLVTTMDVRGVTKLYCRDISKALAVVLAFSSGVPLLLPEGKYMYYYREIYERTSND